MFANIRSNRLLLAIVTVSFVAAFALVWTLDSSALEPGGKKAQHVITIEGKGSAEAVGSLEEFGIPSGQGEDICAEGYCELITPDLCYCSCYGTRDCCEIGCAVCCGVIFQY